MSIEVCPAGAADGGWIRELLEARWGGVTMVSGGKELALLELPGLVAWDGGRRVGLATLWSRPGGDAELVSLDSIDEGRGVGSRLLAAAVAWARAAGAAALCVVTTNDNLPALGFYQRRGFVLAELRPGAVGRARERKPAIPETGWGGIPLRDEIELRHPLSEH